MRFLARADFVGSIPSALVFGAAIRGSTKYVLQTRIYIRMIEKVIEYLVCSPRRTKMQTSLPFDKPLPINADSALMKRYYGFDVVRTNSAEIPCV